MKKPAEWFFDDGMDRVDPSMGGTPTSCLHLGETVVRETA
jgi:hypothetical protein